MNENIDLTKILNNCPVGTEFYHAVYEKVWFCCIDLTLSYPIRLSLSRKIFNNTGVTSKGSLNKDYNGECLLFPSKNQRDWSKFTAPWLEKQGDSLRVNDRAWLSLVSDVLTWKDGVRQYLDNPRVQELAKRLCSEYAQKLYNPSVLSNSSNTGKNEQKFDPNTLQPYDKILVRDSDEYQWKCTLYSHQRGQSVLCKYVTTGASYEYCIPYNDDTKHLVGTTEEAPEFYRYWED